MIATRCKTGADARSIDKVEVCRAGVLVEAKGHFEDAGADLRCLELAIVDIHVAPLMGAELVFDLVVEDASHASFDADPAASDVEPAIFIARMAASDLRTSP